MRRDNPVISIKSVSEKDNLKTRLKCFAIKHINNNSVDPLSKEEKLALKSLKNNREIIIKRPDKGGGVVIMNTARYQQQLQDIVSDSSKFEKCNNNQSNMVKEQINKIANEIKALNPSIFYKIRRKGDFTDGHLYGLPKIHKNKETPPLRPIISMSGTVTHDIAQYLNKVIRPYLNSNYIINSSDQFLAEIQDIIVQNGESIASLDVESLFTNVPVQETTEIIIKNVYHHETKPAPNLPEAHARKLLSICTTSTPFECNGTIYKQIDGVSMGSPLGPTYADFYMSNLENNLMNQHNRVSNPKFYRRYVDDIFAIFKKPNHISLFKQRLSRNSVLKFTHEEATSNSFQFLDIKLNVENNGSFSTTVYIKPTDKGLYTNFDSHIPISYKKSIVKSLVHRALKYTSTWEQYHTEIKRIQQTMANNSFPQHFVEKIIKDCTNNYINKQPPDNPTAVKLFVQLQNLQSFKRDRKQLASIVKDHVKPSMPNTSISILAYYRPVKLSSVFSTRPRKHDLGSSCVVYRFSCPKDGCNASYLGYTTCTLSRRSKQHRYNSSSIYKHFRNDHNCPPPDINEFSQCFAIVRRHNNIVELRIAESLLIKEYNPFINIKYNECSKFCNLFR